MGEATDDWNDDGECTANRCAANCQSERCRAYREADLAWRERGCPEEPKCQS